MLFHKAGDTKFGEIPKLILEGEEIERVYTFKYLGIHLDPTLSFRPHLASVESRISQGLGRLYGIRRLLTTEISILLLKAYILPI